MQTPPGYNPSIGHNHVEVAKDTDQNHLILKKSWDLALGPIKQVSRSNIAYRNKNNSYHSRTGSHEYFDYVHVRQLYFDLPHYDGGHDVDSTIKSHNIYTSHVQGD